MISPQEVEYFYHTVNIQKLLEMGVSEESALKMVDKKSSLSVERVERILREKSIRIIHRDDSEYPETLKNIADAPTILYVR